MFKNYLKTAWRNLMKSKVFSFINIVGLATGLTCFILIAIYVFDELNYDRYPANAKQIYRMTVSVAGNGTIDVYPNVDNAVGEGVKNAFPEIKSYTRVFTATDFIRKDDIQFKEKRLAFADANFFRMFSIPLLDGNEKTALVEPNTVVISKDLSKRYFGNANPIGQSLTVGLRNALYKITGVYDKIPDNSHFHFDAVMSSATFTNMKLTWSNIGVFTYVELNEGADSKKLMAKFPGLVSKYVVPEVQVDMGVSLAEAQKSVETFVFGLQPLTDIHLYSHTKYELEPPGDIQYVYFFSALACFILLLACINFTNLSIARSSKRAREVGVRKVMGSEKGQLVRQFLSESVLMSACAMLIAVVLVYFGLPLFNQLTGQQLDAQRLLNIKFISALVGLVMFVGLIAGVYPAFYLSAFNPVRVLKGTLSNGNTKTGLRGALIVFQFFVSTVLICSTIIVYQQLNFMLKKNPGYDRAQVIFLPDARLLGNSQDAFRDKMVGDSRVVAASVSRYVPGEEMMDGTQVHPVNEKGNGTEIHMNIYHVDYDYLRTLGMQIKKGRFFQKDFGDSNSIVINEAAVQQLGWHDEDAIGKTIVRSGQHAHKVIGIVNDFNYTSARQSVAPLMMTLGHNYGGVILKVKTADMTGFLKDLKTSWNSFHPQGPINYYFLDERFAALYASEQRTREIFTSFAIVAVIIAGLGLFGISAFIIEQRTKEIGVRKVLGASVRNLVMLVSKEFLVLVGLAFIVAVPVAWWTMHRWLETYAYRINITAGIFLLTGLFVAMIAMATISFQAIKAALANPVKSLKTE